ncbi:MAG TPA: secretin N-terminal domain-containing protein [Burkholderiales bacterium]|jgi:hypothetical protein
MSRGRCQLPSARRWFAALLLAGWTAAGALAQQTVLEVIPLRYRTAPEVIPVIQPLLGREGTVSGFQGQLVVRATPANLEEIKRILASVDTAPRQLLVTLRQEGQGDRSRSAAEVSGSVGGDHGRVTVPGGRDTRGGNVVLREGDDHVRLHVLEGSGSRGERGEQSVRVLEGREAFLGDAASGVYVRPRVAGDRVTVDVSAQRESLSSQPHRGVNVQGVVTTVSGRLGEWIEIGGVSTETNAQQSALLGRSSSAARETRRVLLKVEEAR